MRMNLTIAAIAAAAVSMLGTIVTLIITTVVKYRLDTTLKNSSDIKKQNQENAVNRQVMVRSARRAREDWQDELHKGIERMQKRTGADDFNGAYHKAFHALCEKDGAITEFDERLFAELQNKKG